jgi:hypothetical protein
MLKDVASYTSKVKSPARTQYDWSLRYPPLARRPDRAAAGRCTSFEGAGRPTALQLHATLMTERVPLHRPAHPRKKNCSPNVRRLAREYNTLHGNCPCNKNKEEEPVAGCRRTRSTEALIPRRAMREMGPDARFARHAARTVPWPKQQNDKFKF